MAKRLDMRLEFQKCRGRGHAWDDFIPRSRQEHPTIYESPHQETLRCIRCHTERFRGIGYTGEVESSYYSYAEDYLMTADDKPELIAIRLSLIAEIKAASAQSKRTAAARRPKKAPAKRAAPRKAPRRHLVAV